MVLLYDLLLGKGIQCGGPMKRFLINHKVELLAAFRSSVDRNSGVVQSSGTYYICTIIIAPFFFNFTHDFIVHV